MFIIELFLTITQKLTLFMIGYTCNLYL